MGAQVVEEAREIGSDAAQQTGACVKAATQPCGASDAEIGSICGRLH
jgi:hypothetical protein